jgi:hypothetical protein
MVLMETNQYGCKRDDIFVTQDAHFSGDYNPDPGHHFSEVTMPIFDNATGTGVPDMPGFAKAYGAMPGCNVSQSHNVMRCYSPEKIPILSTLATQYAICDAWFFIGSWPHITQSLVCSCCNVYGAGGYEPLVQ